MSLRAVRCDGIIVDFVWISTSMAAARMLGFEAPDLYGKHLRAVLAEEDGCEAVFDQYRCVIEQGAACAAKLHQSRGSHDLYRHGAVRMGDDGVAVTLFNVSAAQRAHALWLALRSQEALATEYADG